MAEKDKTENNFQASVGSVDNKGTQGNVAGEVHGNQIGTQIGTQHSYTPIMLDDVRQLLDSKLVSAGVPGALVGIAINQAFQSKWGEAAKFGGAAALVWFLIKIGSKLISEFESFIDKVLERLGKLLGRIGVILFKKQYLEALKTHCYALEVEGFRGNLPRLPLKEIFVPLRLDSDPDSTLSRKLIKKIWDLLPKDNNTDSQPLNSRLVIIADPGYGKTTLTRYLTLSYADGSYRSQKAKELIPILLLFRTIHSQIQDERTPTLPGLIAQQILNLPRCQDLQPSAEWLVGWLEGGKCLVMLDGLDEVPQTQREKVSRWTNWQMRAYLTPFILTSRPHGYDSTLFQGVQPVKIEDFTNDQKSDFISKWYQSRIREQWQYLYETSQQKPENERLQESYVKAQSAAEAQSAAADLTRQLFANPALNELAKNPLLLTIIAVTHEAFGYLPKERTGLYRKILNLLLENRPNFKGTHLTIRTAEDNQRVLQELALRLVEQNQMLQFTPEQARPWIQARLSKCCPDSSLTPEKFLREIQTVAGLLVGGTEDGGGLYQFIHKTFQEYLTAVELNQQGQERRLIEQFYNPDWKEVICFYATLTSATPFLRLVLETPPENPLDERYALELARRLVELGSKVDSNVRQRLDQALEQTDLGDELNAAIRLDRRFRNLTPIDDQTAISDCITWGEYQLFLEAQEVGQFHSSAEIRPISQEQVNQPVVGISWEDAQWFCAWLATQASLQSEDGVYDYRLPTDEERSTGVSEEMETGDFLRVVRVQLPNRYGALLNYLANGCWREADHETYRVMLQTVGREEERGLPLNQGDLRSFPCQDLFTINELWERYSNGKFGFRRQTQIWLDCGGQKWNFDIGILHEFFWTAVRWGKEGTPIFQLEDAPPGHLPHEVLMGFREVALMSRFKECVDQALEQNKKQKNET